MKNILISGVSSGIGRTTCIYFLERGWRVFGSVRQISDATQFELYEQFVPLTFDVTDEEAIRLAAKDVKAQLNEDTLDLLVCNAGIAVIGPLMHLPISEFEHQLDVNVNGTLRVIQTFLPCLGAHINHSGNRGKIVIIGSVSGLFASPFLGPYCASKYALEAISDVLRRELSIFKIPVSLIQPASTKSDIWDKVKVLPVYTAGTAYEGFMKFRDTLISEQEQQAFDTDRVAKVIWKIAKSSSPRARYLVTRNNLLYRLYFAIPDRLADRIFIREYKKKVSRLNSSTKE